MKKITFYVFLLLLNKNLNAQLTNWQPLAEQQYGGMTFSQSSDGSKIYKGTYSYGVYKSLDFGNTWQSIYPTLIYGANSIAMRGDTLFANLAGCGGLGIQYTPNDGQQWIRMDNGFMDTVAPYFIAVNQTSLFVASADAIYKTDNLGTTWQVYPTSHYTGDGAFSVCTDGNNICVGSNGKVHLSNDNGLTWQKKSIPGTSGYAAWTVYIKGNTIFAGFGNGLYRSLNSGNGWSLVGLPGRNVISFNLIGKYGFAGTDDGFSGNAEIFFSTDSGATWTQSTLSPPSSRGVWGFIKTGNRIIAGGWDIGMWYIDLFTGIKNPSNSNKEVSVFPNPARDFVNVIGNISVPAEFSLFNTIGEKVLHAELEKIEDGINIVTSNLSSGVYVWKLTTRDKIYNGKILFEN